MKNVIVFALGKMRYAVELRWVREVVTLGHVTPVPRAPASIAGVVNSHGGIMPVLNLTALLAPDEPTASGGGRGNPGSTPAAHRGDGAVLVQVEELRAAIRVDNVDEVSTLKQIDEAGETLVDSAGREVTLIDPPALLGRALGAVKLGAEQREGRGGS